MEALPEQLDATRGVPGGGAPSATAWQGLREEMQGACLLWLQHATPEIVQQACP